MQFLHKVERSMLWQRERERFQVFSNIHENFCHREGFFDVVCKNFYQRSINLN